MSEKNVRRPGDMTARVLIRALIGGLIVSSLIVFPMFLLEERFLSNAMIFFGTSGFVCGAICGAVIGIFGRKVELAIAGAVSGLGCFILATFGILWYSAAPWPAPKPYPSVDVQLQEGSPGSWGLFRSQMYTHSLSLDDVQQHYEKEMGQYCEGSWQFKEFPGQAENSFCRQARCEIYRLGMEQYFEVELCSISDTETVVTQFDFWED